MAKVLDNDDGIRPAGKPDECFYCQQKVGMDHKIECVAVNKKVMVRATIEYEIEIPNYWGRGELEFHRNEGSWCSDNMIDELQKITENGCLCPKVEFEYIRQVGVGGYSKEADQLLKEKQ